MKKELESLFIYSLVLALVSKIAIGLGLGKWAIKKFDLTPWMIEGLPWLFIALMAVCVYLLSRAGMNSKGTAQKGYSGYIIGWAIAALLCFVLWDFSDAFADLDIEFEFGESSLLLRFANYVGHGLLLLVTGLFAFGNILGLQTAAIFAIFTAAVVVIAQTREEDEPAGKIEKIIAQNIVAKIAAVPMIMTALGVFVGCTIWTIFYSFTKSGLLPKANFVGLDQYERLWDTSRWIISIKNLAIYGVCSMILSLLIGFILAALLDQKIRFENTFRTILLYPFALSFIVTGLVWQWILNPEFGIQKIVRDLGFESFTFDPLYNPDIVIFGILIAGLWQGTGLIMCLMLAGLRGIDEDIWKAARVDGIPMWKTYLKIVIPMMRPVFITTLVLIASGIVRVYDLVVAQTNGGPGISSEVPAKYVYDYMFGAQNLGQGFAASTVMLLAVLVIIIPWAYLEFGGRRQND